MKIGLIKSHFLPAVLLAISISVQAAVPDAGQTSRELQQPETLAPETSAPLLIEGDTAPKNEANNSVRIAVKTIHLTGNSIFTAGELEALVDYLIGSEHSLAELEAGAGRITAYYRSHGYPVARAYLPAQDIKDGTVTIGVLEGRIGEHLLNNQSRLSDERVNGYLGEIRRDEALQARSADRALLLLGDTPGVGTAKASLQPGTSAGTSDLVVELTQASPYTASVELDNHGNRYTGENRLGVEMALNSLLGRGEQLSLSALTTDQHLAYMRAALQMPVGNRGLRLGSAFSGTRYRLGKEFSALEAHGSAANTSLYVVYPFIRSQAGNLTGIATWESKRLSDSTQVPVTQSDKQVRLFNLGLAGNRQDSMGGGGITSFDLSWVSGNLAMDAVSLAVDELSANSNGAYRRLGYHLRRLQRLTSTDTLSLALSGQWAGKNLGTSEKFYLGGADSIRAYPQGDASGDEGYLATLEMRHDYAQALQALLFYDAGSVKLNRNQYTVGTNTRHIAGAGIGINAMLVGIQIKASLAWRTRGGDPASESSKRNPRLWLLAGWPF